MVTSQLCFSLMALVVKLAGKSLQRCERWLQLVDGFSRTGKQLPPFELVFIRSLVALLLSTAACVYSRSQVDITSKRTGGSPHDAVLQVGGIAQANDSLLRHSCERALLSSNLWGPRDSWWLLCLKSLCGFLSTSAIYYSLNVLSLGDAVTLSFTSPIFTAAIAAACLAESFDRLDLIASAVSLAGVVLIARPPFLLQFWGAPAAASYHIIRRDLFSNASASVASFSSVAELNTSLASVPAAMSVRDAAIATAYQVPLSAIWISLGGALAAALSFVAVKLIHSHISALVMVQWHSAGTFADSHLLCCCSGHAVLNSGRRPWSGDQLLIRRVGACSSSLLFAMAVSFGWFQVVPSGKTWILLPFIGTLAWLGQVP